MTLTVATVLAGLVAALSPLLLSRVKLDGVEMAGVSYLTALLIAAGAGLATGQLHFDRASLLTILGGSAAFWSIQQAVYRILVEKVPADHPLSVIRPATSALKA